MKNSIFKIVALILALLMSLSSLAACDTPERPTEEPTEAPTTASSEVPTEKATEVPDIPIEAEDIEIGSDNIILTVGETVYLTATVTSSNADDKSFTWSSSNTSIAIVGSDGKVLAVGEGVVFIIATLDNGEFASCKLTVCNHTHTHVLKENLIESTCTATGSYDNVKYCNNCSIDLSRDLVTTPALGHTAGAEATCTTAQVCMVCQAQLVAPFGHIPATAVEENRVEPTCTEDGSYDAVVYCDVCEAELSRENHTINATGHTPATAVEENRIEPTCTDAGSYDAVVYCSVCNDELSRKTGVLSALGHTEITDDAIEPTCTKTGLTEGKHCSDCNTVFVKQTVVEATGHNYKNYNKNYICIVCGDELIPSEGLKFASNSDGTCIVTGIGTCTDTCIVIPLTSPTGHSVTGIESMAFFGCSTFTSIVIPSSVTRIGDYAFGNCTKLVEVINKSSLNIIAGSENHGLVAYYAIEVHNSGDTKIANQDDYQFYTYNGKHYLVNYIGADTALALPENYKGENYEVHRAFYNNDKITSVVIPDSVTSIGSAAFYRCSSLTSIEIPDSVTSIGECAFYSCDSLTSVVIGDSVTSIGSEAFWGCSKLIEVINKSSLNITAGSSDNGYVAYYAKEVHSGESKIVNYNDYLFYTYGEINYLLGYIGNDTELALPNDYNGESYEIYKYAFDHCDSLTRVVIPDSVTSIGFSAFSWCSRLTSVEIGDSVASIGDDAFRGCSSLTSAVIPDSVTSIGEEAFYKCSSLTIYCEAESQPSGWVSDWNSSNCPVVWGYKEE